MIISIITYILPVIGILILASFVLAQKSAKENVYYFIFSALIAIYVVAQFFVIVGGSETALFALQISSSATNLTVYFVLLFCLVHAKREIGTARKAALLLLPIAFLSISFTDLIIKDVVVVRDSFQVEGGALYSVQAVFLVMYLLVAIAVLVRSIRHSRGLERSSTQLMLLGLLVPMVVNTLTNTVFLQVDWLQFLSPVSFTAFVALVGYAIIKHRLFDTRLVIARSLAYLATLAVVAGLYGLVIFTVASLVFGVSVSAVTQVLMSLATGVAAMSYPKLRSFFDRVTNKLFYRDAYDPQEFLDQLNAVLVGNIELNELVDGASTVIASNLKSEFVTIGLNDKERSVVTDRSMKLSAADARDLRGLLEVKGHKMVQTDSLPADSSKLRKLLRKYDIALVYALLPNAQDLQSVGYLILGNKKSGNMYSRADQRLLEVVADELAITVQNALHFQEIKGFSATLQRRVDTATRELRHSNEKLKQLDEVKDEFLSMASHQLRTPLTSVKGFISMVLEGDVGTISPQQRTVLEQAFDSSQRMVFLIGDFLNVSRIQSGKFVVDKAPFDIVKLIHEEVNQLRDSAKTRGLEFVYDPPAHMPEVVADKDKLRQVMMNFMDNALYYSPNGGKVTIKLYKDASGIVFKVSDTGIGVPKAEQEKLFTKFFRAENARQQRPDGTGIGLFMAKKVVVGHGGTLIFESVEGKGSTFGFRLPLKDDLKKLEHKPDKDN